MIIITTKPTRYSKLITNKPKSIDTIINKIETSSSIVFIAGR